MKPLFLVAALPLLAGGCASTLPDVIAASAPPDAVSEARRLPYSSPLSGYTHRMPVDPKPWREQNDAQAPKGGA